MDRQTLLQRQQTLADQFNSIRTQIDQKRQEVEAGETELVKLQGRYAEIEELLRQLPEEPPMQPEVINAVPAESKDVEAVVKEPSNAGSKRRPKG